jgi:hypothetical protein
VVDTTLDSLTGLAGRHVRVSGALRRVDRSLLTMDDGATFTPPLAPGEVLNVTGVVAERDVGGWEVLARSEALVRASSLSLPTPVPTLADIASVIASSATPSPATATAPARVLPDGAGQTDPLGLGPALWVGAVAALVVVIGGVLVTRPLRRHEPGGHLLTRPAVAAPPAPPTRPGEGPDRPLDAP